MNIVESSDHRGRSLVLPNIAKVDYFGAMGTMNISLPDALRNFVEEQVAAGGYSTSSEYVRDLIRKEQTRAQLRQMLLEGASSKPLFSAEQAYFRSLRKRASDSAGE
jgi:antitoxin ParD1/3/4